MNDLVIIPPQSISTVLAADKDDILGSLAAKVHAFEADVSTPKGRAAIAHMSREVSSAKIKLIALGKDLTDGWRTQTKLVMDECKIIQERMNELRDQVRAPLTEYERIDSARVAGHEAALAALSLDPAVEHQASAQIAAWMDSYQKQPVRDWQEYTKRAMQVYEDHFATLRGWYQAARTREDEAEAARVAAEQEREAREARIAEEAAQRARQKAEADAAKAIEDANRRAAVAEHNRVGAHKVALFQMDQLSHSVLGAIPDPVAVIDARMDQLAIVFGRDWEEFSPEAELLLVECASRLNVAREVSVAYEAKIAADRADAAQKAQEAAVAAERDRLEAINREMTAKRDQEQAKREADVEHKRTVHKAAREALILAMSSVHSGNVIEAEEIAVAILTALVKGEIPHIRIEY